ncbi:MAG: Eco57I restriction-modification methylase domain-containing protein [Candidatus Thorarchaeota archaeon]
MKARDTLAASGATPTLANLVLERMFFVRLLSALRLLPERALSDAISETSRFSHLFSLIVEGARSRSFSTPRRSAIAGGIPDLRLFVPKHDGNTPISQFEHDILLHCAETLDTIDLGVANGNAAVDRRVLLLGLVHEALKNPKGRKRTGVFYTPFELAKTICTLSLESYLEDREKSQALPNGSVDVISPVRVLDNACGGGVFILAMLEKLISLSLLQSKDQNPFYSVLDKQGIDSTDPASVAAFAVEHCLFGVDLDRCAVSVTEAQLWTTVACLRGKLLEGVCRTNLFVGNSLLSQWPDGTEFDIIVGNPPYMRLSALDASDRAELKERYATAREYNTHAIFIQASLNRLKKGGVLGYLIHKNLLSLDTYAGLRQMLLTENSLRHVSDCGAGVFRRATAETSILVLRKGKQEANSRVALSTYDSDRADCVPGLNITLLQYLDLVSPWNHRFLTRITRKDVDILDSLKTLPRLESLASISRGIETGSNRRFVSSRPDDGRNWQPVARGRDIAHYRADVRVFLDYDRNQLAKPGRSGLREIPKVLVQQNARNPIACYDSGEYLALNSATYLADAPEDVLKSLCLLINSQLVAWFFRTVMTNNAKLTVNLLPCNLGAIPVPRLIDTKLLGALCDVLTSLRLAVEDSHYPHGVFSTWYEVIAEATVLDAYHEHQNRTRATTEGVRALLDDSLEISELADLKRNTSLVKTAQNTIKRLGVSALLKGLS